MSKSSFKHTDGLGNELLIMPAHGPRYAAHVMTFGKNPDECLSIMLPQERLQELRDMLDQCEAALKTRQGTAS